MTDGHEHAGHDHGGHAHLSHVPDAARAAVFAARASVTFEPPARCDQLDSVVGRFFAVLWSGLAGAGCTLVGHVKGSLNADDCVDLTFHATVLGAAPAVSGVSPGAVEQALLTVNVIVFGVDERSLPAIVRGAWSRASGAATTWRG